MPNLIPEASFSSEDCPKTIKGTTNYAFNLSTPRHAMPMDNPRIRMSLTLIT